MKKNMSGLIVGILIAFSISVFAEGELTININSFPINVNGQQQNIEAYNINGSTYIKLLDIQKAAKGVLEVNFDQENQIININTIKDAQVSVNVEKTGGGESVSEKTSDGLPIIYIDEKPYIYLVDFHKKYEYGKRTNFYAIKNKWDETGMTDNIVLYFGEEKEQGKPKYLLENIPSLNEKKNPNVEYPDDFIPRPKYIPLDYYVNKILPAIEANEKNRVN